MAIDVSRFHTLNVTDTCAIWNVLSSRLLYSRARFAGCHFCCTGYVYYECLYKPRTNPTPEEIELQRRFHRESEKNAFQSYQLDIEDLQDVAVLENRKRLSKGELSSIAFAQKTQQAFLTDDQKARKLAENVLERKRVQTTPHLFGWLYYNDRLGDNEKDQIIGEHKKFGRPLAPFFERAYQEALRCRSMNPRNS
jgi:hypothetical protein